MFAVNDTKEWRVSVQDTTAKRAAMYRRLPRITSVSVLPP
jgi:hypothetical protein